MIRMGFIECQASAILSNRAYLDIFNRCDAIYGVIVSLVFPDILLSLCPNMEASGAL